ncbi:MAG: AI-2E family transporter, partial [Rubricoccaceae bacterium]|nr:AI-2E family transporter [Rubricoccaceae bacterium]
MNIQQRRRGHVLRGLVAVASLVIVIAGLRAARPVVVPMLVSAFVAFACLPAETRLRKWGLPKALSVTIVVIGVVAIVSAVGAFVGSSLTSFVQTLPDYQAGLEAQVISAMDWLERRGFEVPDRSQLQNTIDPGAALGLAATLLNGVGDTLANGLLILIAVVFILLEASSFRAKLQSAFHAEGATF